MGGRVKVRGSEGGREGVQMGGRGKVKSHPRIRVKTVSPPIL